MKLKFADCQNIRTQAGAPWAFPSLLHQCVLVFCKAAPEPEGQSVASECKERNSSVVAGGVLLQSMGFCPLAAGWSVALERSPKELGLVRIWEIILGLHNLI